MTALEPGSFYAELTPEERRNLEKRGRYRDLERGEVLFREGEWSTWVAVLLAGRVKAYSDRVDGGEALLDVRGPGALLGELAAIDGLPRSATVATMEPARILAVTEEEFMGFLAQHGRVSVLIMKMLCRRWREADRRRVEFGMFDATGRVAQRLVELAERFGVPYEEGGRPQGRKPAGRGPNGPGRPARPGERTDPDDGTSVRITLHLSQEELAGWVGASREAVSKALGTLRRHGWIETGRRRVIVHDLEALRRHAR
jgi:CRP/FNR family transcriptional regulator, cyclic AMP receptor protein